MHICGFTMMFVVTKLKEISNMIPTKSYELYILVAIYFNLFNKTYNDEGFVAVTV